MKKFDYVRTVCFNSAKGIGFSGLCVIMDKPEELEVIRKKKVSGLDISTGLLLEAKPGHVRQLAKNHRNSVEIIAVKGGNLDVNRAAVESPEVDILASPWGDFELRNDTGINHVIAKLAKKNNVAIEFNFRQILHSHKKNRVDILKKMQEAAKFVRKYKAPFLISSGAMSKWDLRSPSDLTAFGKILGFNESQVKHAFSDFLIKENRKRLSGKWLMPGVEKI